MATKKSAKIENLLNAKPIEFNDTEFAKSLYFLCLSIDEFYRFKIISREQNEKCKSHISKLLKEWSEGVKITKKKTTKTK